MDFPFSKHLIRSHMRPLRQGKYEGEALIGKPFAQNMWMSVEKCNSDGFAFNVFMKHHLTNHFCIQCFFFVLSSPCFEGVFAFLLISGAQSMPSAHAISDSSLEASTHEVCDRPDWAALHVWCWKLLRFALNLRGAAVHRPCVVKMEWEFPTGKPIRVLSIKKNCLWMHCRQTPSFCLAVMRHVQSFGTMLQIHVLLSDTIGNTIKIFNCWNKLNASKHFWVV